MQVKKINSKLKIDKNKIAPVILPDYIPDHVKKRQMTSEFYGTLS
ncbi:MAG: hypothetical protein PF551_02520 [Candidatus Marinimicrobia bacterium]|nr:hypothetical protein [Candidatus Neomarinimicrobiota bacterium]